MSPFNAPFPYLYHEFLSIRTRDPDSDFARYYVIRTFNRFLEWFGMVKIAPSSILSNQSYNRHKDPVTRIDVVDKVLEPKR